MAKAIPSSHVFSLYVEPSSLLKVEVNPFKNVPLDANKSTENIKKSWEAVDQLDCPFLNIEKYSIAHHYTYGYSDGLFTCKDRGTQIAACPSYSLFFYYFSCMFSNSMNDVFPVIRMNLMSGAFKS